MSTPEEVQDQLLASIQRMADAMVSMGEMTKTQFDAEDARLAAAKKQADERKALEGDRIKEEALKNGRLKTSSVEEAKHNRELSKQFRNRLGVEEEINPRLKKVLETRSTIEQRLVDAAKRQYGDEVFNLSQRNKFFREQLQQYSAGNLAHGGVVTQFKDLSKQQQDAIVDAVKTQKKLQLEQANFTQTVQKLANPGIAVEDMKRKFSTLGGAVDTGKESLIKMAGGGSLAFHSFEILFGVGKVLGAALEGAAKAALGMTKSLLNGERGMAVGAKANETLVKSITGVVGGFGSLLMGIGGVLIALAPFSLGLGAVAGAGFFAAGATIKLGAAAAETAAELNTFAAELNDKLYKGFAELGKLSMTGARGMTGVIDNLHKMGLTVSEFDKLNKVISANAKEMKMFGVTAEQGVNKFAETAGELYKSEMGRTFELMAISAEDQYEHTAKFLALQARLGLTQEKNSKQEQAALGAYIEELDKIATLTGASRKEQEDARNAVMAIEQLRAGMLVEQKNAELTGDYSRVEEIKRAIEVATTLQAKGMVREATGVAKLTATNGVVTDATGSEVLQMMGGPGGVLESLKKGTGTAESRSLDALNSVIKQATRAAEMGGMYGAPMEGLFGGTYAAAGNVSADLMELNKSEAAEKSKLGDKYNRQEHLDRITSTRVAKDPTAIQNVDNNRLLMKNAVIMDKVAFALNEMLLNDINSKPAKIFDSAVDKFAEAVGYKGTKPAETPSPGAKTATIHVSDETQTNYANAKLLKNRKDSLEKSIADDEEKRTEAIRSGATDDERKLIDERIN
jgi:hypothetical protein